MGKENKCSDLNLNDSGSIFFWGLIVLLFLLVIGNFILTMSIISFFKIGMGMESIKLIPELKTIKFFGVADFNRILKKDGLVESFRDSPMKIEAYDSFLKVDLLDRKYQPVNKFMMGLNGTEFKGLNELSIKDPDTKIPFFSSNKLKYNIEKVTRNLEANVVHAAEVVSAIDQNLEINAQSINVRGVEGTSLDGKMILMSAEGGVFLKSSNGSIKFIAQNGIHIDIDRIPVAPDVTSTESRGDLQYKLCLCYPKGTLYRVSLLMHTPDPCKDFNPCS